MGITKSEIFTAKQNKLATILRALAHPARIAILQTIAKADQCICGELVEELGLAQATISQHLKELKAAGLIKGEIEGKKVCYCIDKKEWERAEKLIQNFFSGTHPLTDNCC